MTIDSPNSDGLDNYRGIVNDRLVDVFEESLRRYRLSWNESPITEGDYLVYLDTNYRSFPTPSFPVETTTPTWIALPLLRLVENYARGGVDPDILYFGVGPKPRPGEDHLSNQEFERRFTALVEYQVSEFAGALGARTAFMARSPMGVARFDVIIKANGGFNLSVVLEGERGPISELLGLEEEW